MNNIIDLIESKSKEFGVKPFIKDTFGNEISYKKFYEKIISTYNFLQRKQIVFSNRAFSIIAPNSAEYLFFLFALQKMGNTAVNLNPALTKSEIVTRLNLADVELLVTTQAIFKDLQEIIEQTKIGIVILYDPGEIRDEAVEFIRLSKPLGSQTPNIKHVAFLQFTGGTSGNTKAAAISHQNVLSNVDQLSLHFESYIKMENQQAIIAFPFYHIFSIVFNLLFFLNRGGSCILFADLRNTDTVIDIFKMHRITFTVGVNTWYKRLMNHEKFSELNLSSLSCSIAGGEYVPVSTKESWMKLVKKPLYSAYGLTETSALAIVSPIDETNIDDSLGIALPGTQVTLLNENNEEIKEDGYLGEIALKGPQLTTLYYKNEQETNNAFANNWFKTGDTAERVDGKFYKFIDRKKDMISVSGNKVYPTEVEEIISRIEKVLDVGVVAKISERSGEEVAACIVVKPGAELADEEIINYTKQFLAQFKVPKYIYRYQELPKSPIGKTLRRALKELINN